MICAREGRRKPESHALVCFRTLVVRVLRQRAATCASDAIARQPGAGSPCSWADSMRSLLRCVRWYAACCAFRMLCGTRVSNECVLTGVRVESTRETAKMLVPARTYFGLW